jgi:hypothetical protein
MNMEIGITWKTRTPLSDDDLNGLFGRAYNKKMAVAFHKILNQSLTWVTAHRNDELIGWINVAWDGFVHAFLVDRTAVNDESGASHGAGQTGSEGHPARSSDRVQDPPRLPRRGVRRVRPPRSAALAGAGYFY